MNVFEKIRIIVQFIAYLSFLVFIGISLFERWSSNVLSGFILLLNTMSFLVILISFFIHCKVSGSRLRTCAQVLLVLSPAFSLGTICFDNTSVTSTNEYLPQMFCALGATLVFYITSIMISVSNAHGSLVDFVRTTEASALMGIIFSAVAVDNHVFGVICSAIYIGLLVFSLHRQTILPIITVPLFVILSMKIIFHDLHDIELVALSTFALILTSESITKAFTSSATALDTWQPVFTIPRLLSTSIPIVSLLLESTLLLLTGLSLQHHKEWWVILPLFVGISVLVWLPLHLAYLGVSWKLTSKLRWCVAVYKSDQTRTLPQIMASRGLRHFALITYPLVSNDCFHILKLRTLLTAYCDQKLVTADIKNEWSYLLLELPVLGMWLNLIVTVIQFIWSWTTMSQTTCCLVLICISIQMVFISLLRELSIRIGGTCCGYALVTPAVLKSRNNENNLKEAQASSSYATRTLRLIQEFFNHHLIDDCGCEYSSEPLTEKALKSKLTDFFNSRTADNEHFDSYFIYYTGPVNDQGDWLLKDDHVFTYAKLMDWWLSLRVSQESRLLLVLDTARSNFWVRFVRKTTATFVGIQTLYVRKESELLQEFNIGDFTRDWIDFNTNKDSLAYSNEFVSPIIVTYGVSAFWTNFRYHEPTMEDVSKHWQENFSINIKPFLGILALFDRNRCCCFCRGLGQTLSLLRMWMWAPDQLDVGHGLKFVRYFKIPKGSSLL